VSSDGLSPNAWLVTVSPDMIGLWRLRKSLALDDARWYFDHGRKTECRQLLGAARSCHREILRIRFYLRSRVLPQRAVETYPLPERVKAAPSGPPELQVLAPRERQYVGLLAQGKDRNGIAVALGLKPQTVAVYHSIASAKLGIKSKELAAHASRQGWGA
jgi:DNA-binding CsgD family transcriptional regulator